jgi:hypothetical protein
MSPCFGGEPRVLTNGGRSSATIEPQELIAMLVFSERWMSRKKIDLAELVTLRESGMTVRKIATRLGVGKTSVMLAMRELRARAQYAD